MSPLRLQYVRLFELLAQLAERRLSGDDANELRQLLIADPVARGIYRQYQVLIAGLSWECTDPAEHAGPHASGSSAAEAGIRQRIDEATKAGPFGGITRPIIQPILGLYRGTASTLSRPVFWSILVAGAIFSAYAGVLLWNLRSGELPSGTDGNDLAVATIRATSEIEWSKDTESPLAPQARGAGSAGMAIAQNQPLSIQSGLIELQLTGGTTLLIEGPADWKINGENSATLTHGKLVAKVPHQAIGFTLETPTAKIIDLGTEFGVTVDNSGGTEVHVLRGTVESTTRQSRGTVPRNPIRLETGEALRIDSSEATRRIAVEGSKFKLSATSIEEPGTIRTYSNAILADRPLAYWPLDEQAGTKTIADRSGNGHEGTVRGAVEFGVAGAVENPASTAARFDGASWIEIAKPEPLSLTEDFTVEAWLRPEPTAEIGRVLSVDPGDWDHGWGFGWMPRNSMGNAHDGILFTLYSVKDYRLDRQPWPTREDWHHVAIVCDRLRSVHQFVDGKWSATVEGQKQGVKGIVQATIGRQSNGTQSYRGGMAHLAVYPRALDERQILRHIKLAAAPAKDDPLTDTNQKR